MGDIRDFILAGHSFGGYVAGMYSTKYHRYVRKLLMLSPAGIPTKPEFIDVSAEMKKLPRTRGRNPSRPLMKCLTCVA